VAGHVHVPGPNIVLSLCRKGEPFLKRVAASVSDQTLSCEALLRTVDSSTFGVGTVSVLVHSHPFDEGGRNWFEAILGFFAKCAFPEGSVLWRLLDLEKGSADMLSLVTLFGVVVVIVIFLIVVILFIFRAFSEDAPDGSNVFKDSVQDFPKVCPVVDIVGITKERLLFC
jgi:hypothetical protein